MDPFTLTDAAGTFVFDGTKGVFTPASGGTAVDFIAASTEAPAADPVATVVVTTASGVVTTCTPEAAS